MRIENPYNPLDKKNLGVGVADALLSSNAAEDFSCRYLAVDDIWIPLAESLLIEMLSPVWNVLIDGFGNHDPGKGRYNQQRSAWDVLHPGRAWAGKLQPNKRSAQEILESVGQFLAKKGLAKDSAHPVRKE